MDHLAAGRGAGPGAVRNGAGVVLWPKLVEHLAVVMFTSPCPGKGKRCASNNSKTQEKPQSAAPARSLHNSSWNNGTRRKRYPMNRVLTITAILLILPGA